MRADRRWGTSAARIAAVALMVITIALLSACTEGGLAGSTPEEKAVVAAELGVNGANENISILIGAVGTEQEMVQTQAISSLGRIGTPEAVEALRSVADHESRICRESVVLALREVDPSSYPQAAAVLVEMGAKALPREDGSDPNLVVRQGIVTSLSIMQDPAGLDFLADRLRNDHDEHIRNAAVLTLGRLGDPKTVDLLIDVFHTDNEKNRSWAVESLGKIGDERGLPVVLEAFEDFDPVCRGKAAWALMQLQGEDSREMIAKALASEEDDMPAVVMAHILVLFGDERAVEVIEERALMAAQAFARAEACRVLGDVGRKETISVLDKVFTQDRDGLVKRESSIAIRKLIKRFPQEKPQQPE